jgi:hypothetical protein
MIERFNRINADSPFTSWKFRDDDEKELPTLPPSPPTTPRRITRSQGLKLDTERFKTPPPLVLTETFSVTPSNASYLPIVVKVISFFFIALVFVIGGLSLYAFYTIPFDVAICKDLDYFSYLLHWARLFGSFECREVTALEILWQELMTIIFPKI